MDVLDFLYINGEKKTQHLPENDAKTDVHGYYKSPTGAVISKDYDGLAAYKTRKAKSEQLNTMKSEIEQMKSDISEIKELLKGLAK